jgi:hypothetical protein
MIVWQTEGFLLLLQIKTKVEGGIPYNNQINQKKEL